MDHIVIGECSLCGGEVVVLSSGDTTLGPPYCTVCRATKSNKPLDMEALEPASIVLNPSPHKILETGSLNSKTTIIKSTIIK